MKDQAETPLTERKIVRRGLIAGVAAAALLKLTGAGKAQAANGDPLQIGNNAAQVATLNTLLQQSGATSFRVDSGTESGVIGTSAVGLSGPLGVAGLRGVGLNSGQGIRGVSNASTDASVNGNGLGFAIWGTSAGGGGVAGDTVGGTGIRGYSNSVLGNFDGLGTGNGVHGTSGSGAAVLGQASINGGTRGFGVKGVSNVNGTGIKGISNASDFNADGDGSGPGIHGKSGTGIGILGQTGSNSFSPGVRGVSSNNGIGVIGVSNTGGDFGSSGNGSGTGVLGVAAGGIGVGGEVTTGTGVHALAASGTGLVAQSNAGDGVHAEAGSGTKLAIRAAHYGNGTAIKGLSNNGTAAADGDGSGIGVHGKSTGGSGVKGESTSAAGVLGVSVSQPGVDGISTGSLGVRGTSTNFVGVVGISTNSHGLYGYSTGVNGVALVGDNQGGGLAGLFQGSVVITGGLQVGGAKNAVIKMQDGTNAAVYCQESPEPYFEDFGRAQLTGGVANVALEREFAQLVAGGDYMVFCFPEGDTRGLFVSRRGPNGFEVRELQGGSGNVAFTYRIVTKRKDIEGRRFARINMQAVQNVAAARAALGIGGPNSAPPVITPPVSPSPVPTPSPSPSPIPGPSGQAPGAGPTGR